MRAGVLEEVSDVHLQSTSCVACSACLVHPVLRPEARGCAVARHGVIVLVRMYAQLPTV